MRHFYCRDALWETFEQMANDFDCSIDYLINEAMRYYARSKNYAGAGQGPPAGQGQYAGQSSAARRMAPPPPPAGMASQPHQQPQQQPLAPPPARRPAPARAPAPAPAYREPVNSTPMLYLIYNGQRYSVSKDQFIIGRGSKTSDLAIKDGNISRKHAAVIRRNGTYYIKDLGSTNGIDYKGMRIDNKRIDEGDVFHICDYELRFTYRAD